MKKLTLFLCFFIFLFSCKKNVELENREPVLVQKHLIKEIQGHSDSKTGNVIFDRVALELGYNQDFSRLIYYNGRDLKSNNIEYDSSNRITKIVGDTSVVVYYPEGPTQTTSTIEFVYDNSGRLSKITKQGFPIQAFNYDKVGRLTTRYSGADKFQYSYTGNNVLPDSFEMFYLNASEGKVEMKFSDQPSPVGALKGVGFIVGNYFDRSLLEEGTEYIYDGDYLIKSYNRYTGSVALYEYQ